MKTIAFFNNKGGVGKTTLVYHLAWMYRELGVSVLAVDLDPQANLSSMFLDEDRLEALWSEGREPKTVFGALQPLLEGTGDVGVPHVEPIADGLSFVPGDLSLSTAETQLNSEWPGCLDRNPRSFRVISALWRIVESAAREVEARIILIDVGPNLGALNRAALICAEHVILPLAADLFSIQGMENLGPRLRSWRDEWRERRGKNPVPGLSLPPGSMTPAGYVVMQHALRADRPTKAYERWMQRIPRVYRQSVLDESGDGAPVRVEDDPHRLAALKHYRSLMPLAQEAHKPIFLLKAADGALGGHAKAVQDCYLEFKALARTIALRCAVAVP